MGEYGFQTIIQVSLGFQRGARRRLWREDPRADSTQAPESIPTLLYTNYSIKRSGKISHFMNATLTVMNYVVISTISILKSISLNMRNTTRMSFLLDLMKGPINGV